MDNLRRMPIPGVGQVYFNQQQCRLTISENLQQHYSFDAEGRFLTGYLDGVNYLRSLSNTILSKQVTGKATKTRRLLSPAENQMLIDRVHTRVAHITAHLPPNDAADLRAWLQTILDWDYARLHQQHATFQTIYKPVSILPPDQYRAVVLQAAEGCSWNRCTFCSFYRDRKFRIKCPTEFRLHARQVKAFLGQSLGLRKSLFLGDANALIIPQKRLVDLLHVVHEEFPIGPSPNSADYHLKGIYSFLDIFGAEQKHLDDYRELHEYGLKRIYIGLETGNEELFTLLNKRGSPAECVAAVQTIKQAGIAVGIILLAGAGGDKLAAQHVQHSIRTIAAMDLGPADIVYLSPLIVSAEGAYSQQMQALGSQPLHQSEVMQQVAHLKAALQAQHPNGPKVSLYHIEEFIY